MTEAALREEIAELTRANRESRSVENERRILQLRHRAAIEMFREPSAPGDRPEPDYSALDSEASIPEVEPGELTAEILRAAILSKGCLLVRGLVPREEALRLEEDIERVFSTRSTGQEGGGNPRDGYYEEMQVLEPYTLEDRGWVTEAGGVWGADSPKVLFDVLDLFDRRGLQDVIRGYIGEPPAISVQKCTLRKVAPDAGKGFPGWHQDGRFLGDVRALNVWLTLTHCGDTAPGLDLVPKRIDDFLPTGTEGAIFDWIVAPDVVDEARGEVAIERPIFEPGDVMLFDDVFLHSTAANPAMPNHRYAVESWFFGPSGFPERYTPLAL
jgi:hypothetical protein